MVGIKHRKVRVGRGSKITLQTSGWSIAVRSYTIGEAGADEFGNMEFIPSGNVNTPEISIEHFHDAGNLPPIHGDPEPILIEFALTGDDQKKTSLSGEAFVMDWGMNSPEDGPLTATTVIKWTGPCKVKSAIANP
jgi:hypothetical protein